MSISCRSGDRGLLIFDVVISLEVPFETELKINNFIFPFILVFPLLLQLLFLLQCCQVYGFLVSGTVLQSNVRPYA